MEQGRITNAQKVHLAREISCQNMESVALGYLGFDQDVINSLKTKHRENMEAFNREILHCWANQNDGTDQVQKLALILFKSANEGGYTNPKKIEDILGVPAPETSVRPKTGVSAHSEAGGKRKSKAYSRRQFRRLAAKLKSPMKQKMKLEVAPWIQDCVTVMDDLYTDLTLEKINDKLISQKDCTLSDYRQVFDETQGKCFKSLVCGNVDSEGERILFKGDPGMGKTTVSKKAAYDWAVKIFRKFMIVFFVFLKLVKPGDLIENVIIQQTPILESLGLEQTQLQSIFGRFGSRCLLILDGLDEHASGKNDDVLKIIRGQKFHRCHVLVTSRPHSIGDLESHFKKIVRVNGFSFQEAKNFAFKILKDDTLVTQVLAYNPGDFTEQIRLNNCPILLSFLCLLVKEDQIDLSNDKIDTGEIYTRMVRCLYKKFAIRRKIDYQPSQFIAVITAVGKIALRTLLTGNPLLKRSDVIKEVGEDAFDYGLLIGHEDAHILIRDETADIFVTFPHRSLQEFLGAFYFIQALNEGESINSLRHGNTQPLFMTNPLFLYFCLWLVLRLDTYFTFENMEKVRDTVQGYIMKKLNVPDLDMVDIARKFPAIDIEKLARKKDAVEFNAFRDILSTCHNVRTVRLESSDSLHGVLMLMRRVLPSINYITVGDFCVMHRFHNVITVETHHGGVNILEKHIGYLGRDLSICIENSYEPEPFQLLSNLNRANIKKVEYGRKERYRIRHTPDTAESVQLRFAHLQHLSFSSISFTTDEIESLSKASRNGNLPCLTHLSFRHCSSLGCNLSLLFETKWPTLTHLGFHECSLNIVDLNILGNMQDNHLPKLLSLGLADVRTTLVISTLSERLASLQSLHLKLSSGLNAVRKENMSIIYSRLPPFPKALTLQGCIDSLTVLADILFRDKLHYLDISFNDNIKGTLSVLLHDIFPSLKTLILCGLELDRKDLSGLAQANVENRFPELRHLDISSNNLNRNEGLNSLFDFSCKWNRLLSLDIMRTMCSYVELHRQVQSGCLSSLQELRVSEYPQQQINIVWPNLQILGVDHPNDEVLSNIANAVEEDKFPSLREVCCLDCSLMTKPLRSLNSFHRLTEKKIVCHERTVDRFSVEIKCPCQAVLSI